MGEKRKGNKTESFFRESHRKECNERKLKHIAYLRHKLTVPGHLLIEFNFAVGFVSSERGL
jgi:hypothetical protein